MENEIDSDSCQWRLYSEPDRCTKQSSKVVKTSMMHEADSKVVDKDEMIKTDISRSEYNAAENRFLRKFMHL